MINNNFLTQASAKPQYKRRNSKITKPKKTALSWTVQRAKQIKGIVQFFSIAQISYFGL